jgi:hypothetical protein
MYRERAPSDCNLSVLLNYILHPCSVHFAGQTGASNIPYVRASFSELAIQYSDMLHSYYAITTHTYAMAVNFNHDSNFRAWKTNHTTNFITGSSIQCNCHWPSTNTAKSILLTLSWLAKLCKLGNLIGRKNNVFFISTTLQEAQKLQTTSVIQTMIIIYSETDRI